jgi:hypothetical protein
MLPACGSDMVSPALRPTPVDAGADVGGQSDGRVEDAAGTDGSADRSVDLESDVPSDASPDASTDASALADKSALVDRGTADAGGIADATTLPDGNPLLRCNGHEALCDRRFDEVVFPASHNSMANADDLWFGPNQEHGIARQLQDGIRAMLIDTYAWNGDLFLCHSLCELGSRRLVDALGDMAAFLRANPNEILALLVEDHISAADSEKAFTQSGLIEWAYVHPSGTPWPTLRAMIASNHRLLVTAENGGPPPPWYHHLWDLASDTPYTFKTEQEFSCRANRGMRSNDLFLLNHWVENPLPDPALSRSANASGVLLARAQACQTESGKLPNFVAVNHYATGDLFAVVRTLNRLPP